MSDLQSAGQIDLGNELACSICTEILYHPLTLLDCLHTFCGACLKEWFLSQATRAKSAHPYTCPACRASVRGTKHNASVATLLDMYLQVNPQKARSAEEKEEQDKQYKAGENVMPKLRRRTRGERERERERQAEREEEERMVNEAITQSLENVGLAAESTRTATRERERPRDGERRRRVRSETRRTTATTSTPNLTEQDTRNVGMYLLAGQDSGRGHRRGPSPRNVNEQLELHPGPARSVEHQSSIRSLLSVSEAAIESEILRQISEDSSLRGMDLDNLTQSQEDELAERIAHAMRRERRREQERGSVQLVEGESSTLEDQPNLRARSMGRAEEVNLGGQDRPILTPQQSSGARTLASNPIPSSHSENLIISHSTEQRPNHRDLLDSTSRSSEARPLESGISGSRTEASGHHRETQHLALPSQPFDPTGIQTDCPPDSSDRSRSQSRRTTDPVATLRPSHTSEQYSQPNQESSTNIKSLLRSTSDTIAAKSGSQTTRAPLVVQASTFPIESSRSQVNQTTKSLQASSNPSQQKQTLYSEPNVSCQRCHRKNIQYEWFYTCSKCPVPGERNEIPGYHVCLSCYRNAQACLHWFGFGWSGWQRFERLLTSGKLSASSNTSPGKSQMDTVEPEEPHVLTRSRLLPSNTALIHTSEGGGKTKAMTTDDPLARWQRGVFCDICFECANDWYWRCDWCNDGEWGFCNTCVNTGRHCTHSLSSLRFVMKSGGGSLEAGKSPAQVRGISPTRTKDKDDITGFFESKEPWIVCAKCSRSIQPSSSRFHCPLCNGGDYDLHRHCYDELVMTGRISAENGHSGWRRCLRGHRMVFLGFEDRDGERRRVVVRDLVGGVAWKEEEIVEEPAVEEDQPQEGHDSGIENPRSRDGAGSAHENPIAWFWTDEDGNRVQKPHLHAPQHQRSLSSSSSSPATHSQSPSASGGISNNQSQSPDQMHTKEPFVFPPDGGIGHRVQARWSYWPNPDNKDELAFPVRAEIKEAENVNDDWWWGVYAGKKGLFPGNYVLPTK